MGLRVPHSEGSIVAESITSWTTILETRSDRCMATALVANLCIRASEATRSVTTLMHRHGASRVAVCFQALTAPNQTQLIILHKTPPHTMLTWPGCPILAPPLTTLTNRPLQEVMMLQDPNRQLCPREELWIKRLQRCPVSLDFNFLSGPILKIALWSMSSMIVKRRREISPSVGVSLSNIWSTSTDALKK